MAHPLVEKLRKARETVVEVGDFEFTIRRPTDLEAQRLRLAVSSGDLIPYVVGWNKVRELDVISGGDPHPLPFDAAVCAEWLADRIDLLDPLVSKIVEAYKAHADALGAAEKN